MDDLAELLVLLHEAESPFTSLHARCRLWLHRERRTAAFRAMVERESRTVHSFVRRRGDAAESPEVEETIELWRREPDSARVEHAGGDHDGAFEVQVGPVWWRFDPASGATSNVGHDTARSAGEGEMVAVGNIAVLLETPALLGPLRFAMRGRSLRAGRAVLVADAWPRAQRHGRMSLALHELGTGADRYRLEVDAERGLVLAVQAFAGDEPFQSFEVLELSLDQEIEDDTFVFRAPQGETIRPPGDGRELRQHVSIPEAQEVAPFTLLIPARVPESWRVNCTYTGPGQRPPSPPSVSINYHSESSHESVSVTLRPSDGRAGPGEPEQDGWEQVRAGAYTAYFAGRGPGRGPQSQLRLEHDGTRVTMISQTLSREQLIALAASLAPAPRASEL